MSDVVYSVNKSFCTKQQIVIVSIHSQKLLVAMLWSPENDLSLSNRACLSTSLLHVLQIYDDLACINLLTNTILITRALTLSWQLNVGFLPEL